MIFKVCHLYFENMKKPSLTFQIFIALILGIAIGLLMQHCSGVAVKYIKPFGVIFLNLIKFIVVPLVMLSIICGIILMKDIYLGVTGDAACSVVVSRKERAMHN